MRASRPFATPSGQAHTRHTRFKFNFSRKPRHGARSSQARQPHDLHNKTGTLDLVKHRCTEKMTCIHAKRARGCARGTHTRSRQQTEVDSATPLTAKHKQQNIVVAKQKTTKTLAPRPASVLRNKLRPCASLFSFPLARRPRQSNDLENSPAHSYIYTWYIISCPSSAK